MRAVTVATALSYNDISLRFLDSAPDSWEENDEYKKSLEKLMSSSPVNDVAERAIALMTQYNAALTADENTRQDIMQIVEKNRQEMKSLVYKKLLLKRLQKKYQLIGEINSQLALFRDLLIHIGTSRDCPELRERIRKLRRSCVDACKHTAQLLLPQIRNTVNEGIPADHPHLVLVFYMCQLFLRELSKCSRLVQLVPMDMSGYFENRAGPSNLGNVISQILLCKTIAPDFQQEEICSIAKDSAELGRLLTEMQEFLPTQDLSSERPTALTCEEGANKWTRKRRRSTLYKNLGNYCCIRRSTYL